MKTRLKMNLQLFAEGGDGGSEGQSKGAEPNNAGQQNSGYTYEQLEEIATSRAEKASRAALADFFRKQGMDEQAVTAAISDYKEKQKHSQPDVAAIQQERDQALSKIQQYENEKLLTGMHVRAEDLDYVAYKVSKMVTDKKDFKAAATEFLKENPRYAGQGTYRISTGSRSGTEGNTNTPNEQINDAIRYAIQRK